MTNDTIKFPHIELEKNVGKITIRVIVDSENIELAYLKLNELSSKLEYLELGSSAKKMVRERIKLIDGKLKIPNIRKEVYRIALAVIDKHPTYIGQPEIIEASGLHSGSVSRALTGSRGNYDQYFEEHEKTYRLNLMGVHWLLDEIIPSMNIKVDLN